MITVKLTTSNPEIPVVRQTPGSKGLWGNCKFYVDEQVKKVDWWVVFGDLSTKEKTICPKENLILILSETEFTKKYSQKFIDQFSTIITSQQTLRHPRVIHNQQGHLWHVGWYGTGSGVEPKDFKRLFTTYDQLKQIDVGKIKKDKLLSIVISNKNRTEGQRKRLEFIKLLKDALGDQFDVFGAGFNMIKNKWDGIAPYKYHLILENSYTPDWWTEKLADAYLAGSYPIHYGCPNIYDYFKPEMLSVIDINDVQGSIESIKKLISGNHYEQHLEDIREARQLVLDKYNIFNLITEIVNQLPSGDKPKLVTLRPENKPWLKKKVIETLSGKGVLYKVPQKIYRIYRRILYDK